MEHEASLFTHKGRWFVSPTLPTLLATAMKRWSQRNRIFLQEETPFSSSLQSRRSRLVHLSKSGNSQLFDIGQVNKSL